MAIARLHMIDRLRRRAPDPDVYVISHPKCGRTWLRVLVGSALCARFGLDERDLLKTHVLTHRAGLPVTKFDHDGTEGRTGTKWFDLEQDKSRFGDKRVVFLARDPRDVMVSGHLHYTRRLQTFQGPISRYVRDESLGVRTLVNFYRIWRDHQDVPQWFRLVRYEDLHADPARCLRSVLEVMGVDDLPDSILDQAVEFARFDNMRRLELEGRFKGVKLRPGDPSDPESFKVRRGRIGGYVDYLSPDDIAFIDRVVAEAGHPFLEGLAAARHAGGSARDPS